MWRDNVSRRRKRICWQVGASLREVSGKQIRWAKAKAALTTLCSRLGYLALIQLLHPHFGLLAGEGVHAAPTKRLKATVSLPLAVPSDAVNCGCSEASDDVLQAYLME